MNSKGIKEEEWVYQSCAEVIVTDRISIREYIEAKAREDAAAIAAILSKPDEVHQLTWEYEQMRQDNKKNKKEI